MRRGRIIVCVSVLCISACASQSKVVSGAALRAGNSCNAEGVQLFTDFAGANIAECRPKGRGYELAVVPEAEPINPSPWYAFRLESTSQRNIAITLNYSSYKHRYTPKVSGDRLSWRALGRDAVKTNRKGNRAKFVVEPLGSGLFVSAQELVTYDDYQTWIENIAGEYPILYVSNFGRSVEGRPIRKIEWIPDGVRARGTVILVGRQHPPEVSGVFALQAFAETLFSNSDLARAFREHYAVLLVPLLNPDGVEKGSWRLNANGVDLNRDWGPFTQPETAAMRDELARVDTRDAVALFIDFHSTFKNVFYTQTDDAETTPSRFHNRWMNALSERAPNIGLTRQGGHNTDRPTSKGFVFATYGAAALTYEMHEEEDRESIVQFSSAAAVEMMKIMLEEASLPNNNAQQRTGD